MAARGAAPDASPPLKAKKKPKLVVALRKKKRGSERKGTEKKKPRMPHRKAKEAALAFFVVGMVVIVVVFCVRQMLGPNTANASKAGFHIHPKPSKFYQDSQLQPAFPLYTSTKSRLEGIALAALSDSSDNTVDISPFDMTRAAEFYSDVRNQGNKRIPKVCVNGRSIAMRRPKIAEPPEALQLEGMVQVQEGQSIHLGNCEAGESYDFSMLDANQNDKELTIRALNDDAMYNGYSADLIGVSTADLKKTGLGIGDKICIADHTYEVVGIGFDNPSVHNGKFIRLIPMLQTKVQDSEVALVGICRQSVD